MLMGEVLGVQTVGRFKKPAIQQCAVRLYGAIVRYVTGAATS